MNWTASLLRNEIKKQKLAHEQRINLLTQASIDVQNFLELEEKIAVLTAELEVSEQNLTNLQNELKEQAELSTNQIQDKNSAILELEKKIQANKDNIFNLQKEIRELNLYHQREIKRLQADYQNKLAPLNKQIAELKQSLLSGTQKKLKVKEKQQQALIILAQHRQEKINNLIKERDSNPTQADYQAKLTQQIKELQATHQLVIHNLETEIKQKTNRLTQLDQILTYWGVNNFEELTNKIRTKEQELTTAKETAETNLAKELIVEQAKFTALEKEKKIVDTKSVQAQADFKIERDNLTREKDQVITDLQTANVKIKQLNDEKEQSEERIKKPSSRLSLEEIYEAFKAEEEKPIGEEKQLISNQIIDGDKGTILFLSKMFKDMSERLDIFKKKKWSDFHKFLTTKILNQKGLVYEFKNQRNIDETTLDGLITAFKLKGAPHSLDMYFTTEISSKALERFMNSLEATIDKDSSKYWTFPDYDQDWLLEDYFDNDSKKIGFKTENKAISENGLKLLSTLYKYWKDNAHDRN